MDITEEHAMKILECFYKEHIGFTPENNPNFYYLWEYFWKRSDYNSYLTMLENHKLLKRCTRRLYITFKGLWIYHCWYISEEMKYSDL